MVPKHVAFAPASQKQLGSRLRSHLPRRANIKNLRFHDLRHAFATRLVESGVDLITVKELLGHSTVKITERYTHPNQKLKEKAVELLAKKPEKSDDLAHIWHTERKEKSETDATDSISIS